MMASNSFCWPRRVSADPASSTWIVASRVAARAVPMNSMIFTRCTGTPRLRAATGSPPEEKIQLPNRVCIRIQVKTTVSAIHQTTAIGMPGASGVPSLRICSQPSEPIHWNSPRKT